MIGLLGGLQGSCVSLVYLEVITSSNHSSVFSSIVERYVPAESNLLSRTWTSLTLRVQPNIGGVCGSHQLSLTKGR